MGKRSSASKDEKIRRKIRKLEKKLENLPPSTDRPNDNIVVDDEFGSPREVHSPFLGYESPRLPPSLSALLDTVDILDEPPTLEPIPGPSRRVDPVSKHTTPEDVSEKPEEKILEEDVLKILGEAPQAESALGKNIHTDIATRWQEILKSGLSKDTKDKLVEQYLIPANCSYLLPPLLNMEAKAALSETLSKRDSMISKKQGQIGVALAALSQVMEAIISNETSKQKLLQPLSDACRLLCDNHNMETKTRRNIIMSSINITLRDALADTSRDKYLFGEDVAETLKIAKNVQRTGESLQRTIPRPATKYVSQPRNNHLNFRGQHRKVPNRSEIYRARVPVPTSSFPSQPPARPAPRSFPYPPRTNYNERSLNIRTQRK